MKKALVIGAGGFIGSHMVKRLKSEGYFVRGVDLKYPEFSETSADEFILHDMTDRNGINPIFTTKGGFGQVYQFAADMGGAGFIFTGDNDADIFDNSMAINLNAARAASYTGVKKFFFSSSACVYPEGLQKTTVDPRLKESDAIPANPDSIYGWEKLAAEKMYESYARNYGLDVRIARFHNIFGPEGSYTGGREKAPAAICRKVAEIDDAAKPTAPLRIWGDGEQTRSFLYIDECIEGVRRMMHGETLSGFPILNIGSDEMISINNLAKMAIEISGKQRIEIEHELLAPLGVRGRNSNNDLIKRVLGWAPNYPLANGMRETYAWVNAQVQIQKGKTWQGRLEKMKRQRNGDI